MIDLGKLADKVYKLACDNGWHDNEDIKEVRTENSPARDAFVERMCNNLHDEVSELHTAWRDNNLDEFCDKAEKMEAAELRPLTYLEEELADIIIRTLDNARHLGVDIEMALMVKHLFNEERPYRHGNKRS